MKIVSVILSIFAIIFTLLMAIITPFAWIGLIVLVLGLYQLSQKRKGKITFSRPGWFVAVGLIFSLVMAMAFVEPAEEASTEKNNEEVLNADLEKAEDKKAEEQKAKEEAEKAAKDEAEKKAAEEKAKEEQKRPKRKLLKKKKNT
ncbi:hypothetical protein ACOI1C_20280 [Bacillus sp. DJP31]|uniref:hypothetical protein n=1 Tax=Bacillus sp. DJP31 TaxID=3409789 RepID=UPI003BB4B363